MDFTLPPRKRAKTKEEKEQRRVERILRNRRAAHASREKKRKYVEYLETYIQHLEKNVNILEGTLSPEDIAKLPLADVLDLKQKIGTINSKEKKEEDDKDVYVKMEDEASIDELMKMEDVKEKEVKVKVEDDESFIETNVPESVDSDFMETLAPGTKVPDADSFFYLSPISINSPVYSPIDLTLEKLDAAEQNSARILFLLYAGNIAKVGNGTKLTFIVGISIVTTH